MDFDRYGLPYKGSKSKLAAKIFEIFPTAEKFSVPGELFGWEEVCGF